MQRQDKSIPAPLGVPWIPGWAFSAGSWTAVTQKFDAPVCYALDTPGDVTLRGSPFEWVFHLRRTGNASSKPAFFLQAHGYVAAGPDGGVAGWCLAPEPGVLWGAATPPFAPSMFSSQVELEPDEQCQWLAAMEFRVGLFTRKVGAQTVFCLVTGQGGREHLTKRAQKYLAQEVHNAIAAEQAARARFWDRHDPAAAEAPLLAYALERLVGSLRAPQGPVAGRWAASPRWGDATMDASELFPLCSVWADVDVDVARDLVKAAFSAQSLEGPVPARFSPGHPPAPAACLPLVVQAAWKTWQAGPQGSFLEDIAPFVTRYLKWIARHYVPDARGIYRWPSADEALIPDTFDPSVATPDLTTLLIGEVEAGLRILETLQAPAAARAPLQEKLEALKNELFNFFWDENTQSFRDTNVQGEFIERNTASGLLPLLWAGLDEKIRAVLMRQAAGSDFLDTRHGWPSWQQWPDDPMPPPVVALIQVLLLEGVRRGGSPEDTALLAARLRNVLLERLGPQPALPADLHPPAPGSAAPPPETLATAALIIQTGTILETPAAPETKPKAMLRWLDIHRLATLGVVFGVLLVTVLATVLVFQRKPTLTSAETVAVAGMARRLYDEGRYAEAMAVYDKLLTRAAKPESFYARTGNTYFKLGNYKAAETMYRQAIEKNTDHAAALKNLAVTLYHQDRLPESAACYERLLKEQGENYPLLKEQAELAIRLIREHGKPPAAKP